MTDASGALVASSRSTGSWWGEVRGEASDAHGVRMGRIDKPRWRAMFPVTVEGNGSLSGVQILRGHRETYAIQFIARTGDQIAEIEATGSDMHGWKHQSSAIG